ncbi:voltage-dependent anion channel-domain-containing protein [Paecilomyces variotii]|uniref:Voltage-dependent anion channel-domain-containing protein n=1 Tax=Byssochlamys spectabilis TaxID=264951 RepID=A0A443HHB6_BYSSP|nr:voltage-dependent anion channel-domain-containing protein [Paecilomyces variotii]RWQ91213.1 voltage-dependent anion channel-domain-containing protein [Paecilomyces variotii]
MPLCSVRTAERNFSPLWFSVSLGTGMASMLLSQLPYNTRGVQLASLALFVLNILVFVTILAISMCRYILYLQALRGVIEDREQILSLPLIPMAYSTLINMITFVLVPLCISRVVIGGNLIGSGY